MRKAGKCFIRNIFKSLFCICCTSYDLNILPPLLSPGTARPGSRLVALQRQCAAVAVPQ